MGSAVVESSDKPLTQSEKAEYAERKKRVAKSWVVLAQDLLAIREKRLYREEYGAFEDFCRGEYGYGRNYANKIIAAGEVGTIVPCPSEAVARELTPLLEQPKLLKSTWDKVSADRVPTAKEVRAAVRPLISDDGEDDGGDEPEAPELYDALKAFRRWYNVYGTMPGLRGLIDKNKLAQLERKAGI